MRLSGASGKRMKSLLTTFLNLSSSSKPIPTSQAKLLPREFLGVEMREDADLQSLSEADQAKVAELRKDLKYLVASGYVIEYSDGRLFLPPPRSEGAGDEDGESKDAFRQDPGKSEKPANQAATHTPDAKNLPRRSQKRPKPQRSISLLLPSLSGSTGNQTRRGRGFGIRT